VNQNDIVAVIDSTKQTYWDSGWAVVEGVFSAAETDPIARLAMAMAISEIPDAPADAAEVDLTAEGEHVPRKINLPFLKNEHFRRFALDERLRNLLGSVVGKPVLLAFDQIFLKPPRHGSAKPYHQDNAYFLCHPDDEVITAWIALDDVDEENGCLRYINGSHRLPILRHHEVEGEAYNLSPDSSDVDLGSEELAPVLKGGVVLHHGKTLHTSHANRSSRWRRAYATHWVTADVSSEIDTLDRAYFRRHESLYASALGSSPF
jgi:ectoine hydroxylase-related dioxygenase (phytanoyl-CoA dioxygenase family)